jgi:DNA primase
MAAKGYSERALIEVGLLIVPDDGAQTYDRFRNRVMFPITDTRGRVIAFGGRALGEARAKYLNSPETSLFHKGSVLYNLAEARAAVRAAGSVTVVEGYMDVVALWQAGIPAVVAPLGTAITERQMAELWRLVPEPVLCMDGDAAGLKAAQRAAHRSLPELKPGHSLRFALLPSGEDPDSLVRSGAGSEGMRKLVDEALPLAEVLWRIAADGDFSTPERRAGLRKDVFELASHIRDATVREYYRRHFAAKLDQLFGMTGKERRGSRPGRRYGSPMGGKLAASQGLQGDGDKLGVPETRRIRVLLATVLNHPEILDSIFEDLCGLHIGDPELDKLSNEIIDIAGREAALDSDQLNTHLTSRGLSRIVQGLTGPGAGLAEKFARPEASMAEAESGWRETMGQHHRAVNLIVERDAAVKALGENMTETHFARLRALQAEQEQQQSSGEDVVEMPGGQV